MHENEADTAGDERNQTPHHHHVRQPLSGVEVAVVVCKTSGKNGARPAGEPAEIRFLESNGIQQEGGCGPKAQSQRERPDGREHPSSRLVDVHI